MSNINYVYTLCSNILEKDDRGFFTPSQFNEYVSYAQEETFNDIYTLYTRALQRMTQRLEYKDLKYSSLKQIQDDLKPCYRGSVSLSQISANTFSFPTDYKYLDGVNYSGIKCEVFHTGDEFSYVNNSRVSPTTAYPAAVIGYDAITAYPSSITSGMTISYYKIPRSIDASGNPSSNSPTWAYTTVGGKAIYNASTSYQLELPESTYNKIIVRVLQLAGMSIRESEVVAFAQSEEMEDLNQG